MKVLFSVRSFWYVKHYESVLRGLAERGHTVHVVADGTDKKIAWTAAVEKLAAEQPRVSFGSTPSASRDPWFHLASELRLGLYYLRFLQPEYRNTPKLLERAQQKAPPVVIWLTQLPLVRSEVGRGVLEACLSALERAVPTSRDLTRFIAAENPDVVVLTPLVIFRTLQLDVLRSAQDLGIRTVCAVASWDHLSSKALIRTNPHWLVVWNETQRREAVELHGFPSDRVRVTGAQCFDHWFERRPASTRDAFCRKVGLRSDRPFLLYVCSALFEGSPSEARFVEDWVRRIESSRDPRLQQVGILVRPHPKRGHEWRDVDLTRLENVAIWPPGGAAPIDAGSKDDYFDSMYHAAGVVGLNTSALIEAAILGRSVHTLLLRQFWENQEGTLHFSYLLPVQGGFLRTASDLDEHVKQLGETLAAGSDTRQSRTFVEAFLRPHGLDVPATSVFLDTLEQLATTPMVAADRRIPWLPLCRPFLYPFALLARRRARRASAQRREIKERLKTERRRRTAKARRTRPDTASRHFTDNRA